jgi:hypothetical protein
MTQESEPQPLALDVELADGVTRLLEEHASFVYENYLQSTLTGQQLLLRSLNGRFYRVLRATRLSDDGAKAMDSIDRTSPTGERFLHKNTTHTISRRFGDMDDVTGELIILPNVLLDEQAALVTRDELYEWLEELSTAEPMTYQLPIGS